MFKKKLDFIVDIETININAPCFNMDGWDRAIFNVGITAVERKSRQIIISKQMNNTWKIVKHNGLEYPTYMVNSIGDIKNIKRDTLLKHSINNEEYHKVSLFVDIGKKTVEKHTLSVHRIVACTFLNNDNNYKIVNHIDGNKHNNRVENLEWCTSSHNRIHAINSGLANHEHCKKKLKIVELDKEFNSIIECSNFLFDNKYSQSAPIHIAKSIGAVLNGKKKTYLKFTFIEI